MGAYLHLAKIHIHILLGTYFNTFIKDIFYIITFRKKT